MWRFTFVTLPRYIWVWYPDAQTRRPVYTFHIHSVENNRKYCLCIAIHTRTAFKTNHERFAEQFLCRTKQYVRNKQIIMYLDYDNGIMETCCQLRSSFVNKNLLKRHFLLSILELMIARLLRQLLQPSDTQTLITCHPDCTAACKDVCYLHKKEWKRMTDRLNLREPLRQIKWTCQYHNTWWCGGADKVDTN